MDLSSAFEAPSPSTKVTNNSRTVHSNRSGIVEVDPATTVQETLDELFLGNDTSSHDSSVHTPEPPQATSVDIFTQDHSTPNKVARTRSVTKTLICVRPTFMGDYFENIVPQLVHLLFAKLLEFDKTTTLQAMDDKQQKYIDC